MPLRERRSMAIGAGWHGLLIEMMMMMMMMMTNSELLPPQGNSPDNQQQASLPRRISKVEMVTGK